ncbi:MAG: hypothetical protein ABSE62_16325 [Chthoniobacteraceae bacterium]
MISWFVDALSLKNTVETGVQILAFSAITGAFGLALKKMLVDGWKPQKWWQHVGLWIGSLGGIFIGLALFLSLLSESMQNSFRSAAIPPPELSIEPLGVAPSVNDGPPYTVFLLYNLRIYNAGSPTVIHGWSLKITGADQKQ